MAKKKNEAGSSLESELEKVTNYVAGEEPSEEIGAENYSEDSGSFFDELDLDEPEIDEESEEFDEEPGESKESLQKMARRFVRFFDALQRLSLRPVYKRTILRPGDKEAADEFIRRAKSSGNSSIQDIDGLESDQVARIEKFMEAMKDLPLSDDDMESLIDPLADVIEKHRSLRMSPEAALVFSLLIVMLPRIEPIMPGLGNLFKKASEAADEQ